MQTILELIDAATLQKLARPENLHDGQDLAVKGKVELVVREPQHVKAVIKKGFPHHTTNILVNEQVLSWGCTCNTEPNLFCKHLVATALALAAQPPEN